MSPQQREEQEHPAAAPRASGLPATYLTWVAGNSMSLLGDSVLYFVLGWLASSYGGVWAGVVLTAVVLPRTMFALIGGVIGDRFGVWNTMLGSNVAMIVCTSAFAIAIAVHDTQLPVVMLLAGAAVIGLIDAVYMPCSGSMPRRLMDVSLLPRGLALQQVLRQGVNIAGPAIGGALVAWSVSGAVLFDTTTFVVMLIVLLAIRPRDDQPTNTTGARQPVMRDAMDGLRVAVRDPLLRTLLLLVVFGAGFLLPVASLLLPLLARENGWSAAQLGLIAGSQTAGVAALALAMTRITRMRRPGLVAGLGLLVAAAGLAGLALSSMVLAAAATTLVIGLGSGMFVTQMAPMLLAGTPDSHLSRVQAVLLMAHSVPLLVTNSALGGIAQIWGTAAAVAVAGGIAAASAVFALTTTRLRQASLPPPRNAT